MHNIPHHIATYHMFHTTSRRHLMSQHVSPDHHILHLTSHYTAVCFPSPFHITTSRSTTYSTYSHSPYLAPFHIHNNNHNTHIKHQHISHHTIFHITLHHHILILHHIWHHNTLHHFPHLTAHCGTCRILLHHISHHDVTFHILYYATFHIAPYSTSHILHFNYTMSEIATFHSAPHFTYTPHHVSYRTIIHIRSLATSRHTIPHHAHILPRHHAMHITT